MMRKKIELLAPAQNGELGKIAVNHGADAVYIGATRFGARVAAGNSIEDIKNLCNYAHRFYAKVYVTLNTILTDQELEEVQQLSFQLYEAGVDAFIIQDFGLLNMDLPPLPLHASTQTDNRKIEKIKLLEAIGFHRAILARELSLSEISLIDKNTNIELEAFVHGALCVSYSGQCYMSAYCMKRSANRGVCSQMCRLPYTLKDANDKVLLKEQHLLSLQDMNRYDFLNEMLLAGITSFKIEGRLKDENYVKNITAYYRRGLDNILSKDSDCQAASSGKTTFFFHPNPQKTFYRGGIQYFLNEREGKMANFQTPKSVGEYVGNVLVSQGFILELDATTLFSNGDGICFLTQNNTWKGLRINKVNGKTLLLSEPVKIPLRTRIYRNHEQAFHKILKGKTAERKIGISIRLQETDEGFSFFVVDEDKNSIVLNVVYPKELSNNENFMDAIRLQFAKLGNTIFVLEGWETAISKPCFIRWSDVAEWKRKCVKLLENERIKNYCVRKKEQEIKKIGLGKDCSLKNQTLDYTFNVYNEKSRQFYEQLGANIKEYAFEKKMPEHPILMTCKYCIKRELACCKKFNPICDTSFNEPLFLETAHFRFQLQWNCEECEMRIVETH